MTEGLAALGILDTSVVIDLERVAPSALPDDLAISTITLAELSAGPMATNDSDERARRQDRLSRAESVFEALPVDVAVARAYARVYAVRAQGRQPRRRFADLLVAATALAQEGAVVTRNPADFAGLDDLIEIIAV